MYYTINDLHIVSTPCAMDTEPNSLESIMAGFDAGAKAFSIDIDMTADGLPVLCDNGLFELADGSKIYLEDNTYFELRNNFKKIVAIGQAIQLIKSYVSAVVINLHNERHLAAIKTLLVHDEHLPRTFITGFDADRVPELKTRFSALNFVANIRTVESDIDSALEKIKKSGADAIMLPPSLITHEICEDAHKYGLLVFSSETNDVAELERLMSIGVNFIYTKYPNLAVPFLPEQDEITAEEV